MDPKKILRQQFMSTVEKQLRDADPPETAGTLKRLIGEGYSEEEAKSLISACVGAEMIAVMETNEPFNRRRYLVRLNQLPKLPE